MAENHRLVLLVDDEESVRGVMRDALLRAGFTVFEAGTFEEAISTAAGVLSDLELLIADVSLPGRNGCELANELRRQRNNLPCLFISGYTGAEVCRAYGISIKDLQFLAKPFHPHQLVERVEQLLFGGPSDPPRPARLPNQEEPRQPRRPQ